MRAVHRAVAELRRGTPVLLDGAAPLLIVPAETAGLGALADLAAIGTEPPLLLLPPGRAAAVLQRPVDPSAIAIAISLPPSLTAPEALRALADPTQPQGEPPGCDVVASPALADAAIRLTKLGRLLPAVLTVPAPDPAPVTARGLLQVSAAEVLNYPAEMAAGLRSVAEARVPLAASADTRIVAFRGPDAGIEQLAILIGQPETADAPLVRLHSECFTGDLLGSLRCDCGEQLQGAIARMAAEGAGALLYLAQEGRGIGLVNKLRAYTMQDRGLDTLDANRALGWGADERSFLIAATMLRDLGLTRIRLLTNNPDKVAAMTACGIEVVRRESHRFSPNGVNDTYLATKAARFGHLLG